MTRIQFVIYPHLNQNERSLKVVLQMDNLFDRFLHQKEKIIIFYMDQENKFTQRYVRFLKYNVDYVGVLLLSQKGPHIEA